LNARNDPITEMISASAMFLRSSGRVMRHSFCHQDAPSTSAAS
jgi:hypothetical protein